MQTQRRWWALGAIVLSMLTIGFDATILNVALPTLAGELHAGTSALQWLVDAYVLVFAGLLLPAGALADRIGRKRMLVAGLAFFGVASLVATLTTSVGALIAARAAMGLGAAVLMPVSMAMLSVLFPPAERPKAVAYTTIAIGVGVPLGPIVGGLLLRHFWWGSVFLVNVPIVVVALVAVLTLIPESRDPRPRRADLIGGLLSTAGLTLFVYGIIAGPERGWDDGAVVLALVAGVLLLAGFVAWELRAADPMIDLGLFRNPRFLWGTVAATMATFALYGLLFVLPQYLAAVRGHDALGTGLRLVPMMAGLIVGGRLSETLVSRLGSRAPIALGMAIAAAGLALGATTTVDTDYGATAAWLAVVGLGVGLSLPPAMEAVLSSLPPSIAGVGMSLTMTLRQVGGALGVALLGSVLSSAYGSRLGPAPQAARDSVTAAVALGEGPLATGARLAFVHGMDVVFVVCAAVTLAGALAALRMPARAPEPAVRGESGHELAPR